MSNKVDLLYTLVMRDTIDNVLITAVRQSIDVQKIKVGFDPGGDPGPRLQHSLSISVRDDPHWSSPPSLPALSTHDSPSWLLGC
jgi:hypothetical protein